MVPENNLIDEKLIPVLGWDVGGAHLKAALLDECGVALHVIQVACPLWRGLVELERAVDEVLDGLAIKPTHHAVTMTGELVDLFESRAAGVNAISQLLRRKLAGTVRFYAGLKGFVDIEQVALSADSIASANWLASACFLAEQVPNALFIDVGSTTSDFVPIANGNVLAQGACDAARIRLSELLYSGVVRTPLMALGPKVLFDGELTHLAAEHFATTADVYRLTGDLLAEDDMAETADGRGKTAIESARRLARMIGHDVEDASLEVWRKLAENFKEIQLQRLQEAAEQVSKLSPLATLVGAGAGKFLVAKLAERMDRSYLDAAELIQAHSEELRHVSALCLPAYAVAHLALKD
ncbi:MAG: hypothetical protein RLZZ98_245 [Pseudomonadota bacterium]